jgi:tripartite-type tricarboxylate transporter receptor subunit TctC
MIVRGSNILRRLARCMLGICLIGAANADEFPTRPIKIVVGFGPGGLGDITARSVAQKMTDAFNRQVVVENMPGAGGMSAAAAVARAAPDGHTLLLVSGQNAISPSLFRSMPYDWATDFAAVSLLGQFDFVIVVGQDSPYKSVGDVIAAAKNDPGRFNIGTISVGSAQHLAALMFGAMTGLGVPTVPFRTTGDVVKSLIAGEIQVAFETLPGVLGQIRSGSLRALAVAADQRLSFLSDVPTVAESGVAAFRLTSWNGMVAPAKTPRDVVGRLNEEVRKALVAPDVRKRFIELGIDPRASTPEEMQAVYDADVVRWRKVIADARIELK